MAPLPRVIPSVSPVLDVAPLGRRRRPSGEPPPLPRPIVASTRWYIAVAGMTVAFWFAMTTTAVAGVVTRVDLAVLREVTRMRADWLTSVMRAINEVGSSWPIRTLAWATIIVLLAVRHFRHLLVYLALLVGTTLALEAVEVSLGRMRPAGVTILTGWTGYAQPSAPVTMFTLVLVGAVWTLVPRGSRRNAAIATSGLVVIALGLARLYLAVDHPTDVLAAVVLGAAIPVVIFRLVTPDDVFPVRYGGGRTAHLDIGGHRGAAIVGALDQQLDLSVVSLEPCGWGGSAGSTPIRLNVRGRDGRDGVLFGKLYALTHLRSDRWYKLARTVRYGRLEDEKPFSTVRRLVEYEDHMLRLMRDAGLPTPAPYGFVEITPEREYLIVMEFLDGAEEIAAGPNDDGVIDETLAMVRRMWDAGVAHRDIKPSNVLVRDGHVFLIDVAFATVRPSPWRQAVDLANAMLTLALTTEPERVYERALACFAPDDIAEAFAASRSITVPTQLRNRLRTDCPKAIVTFRKLAPERSPISIQLWSLRRVAVTVSVLVGGVILTGVLTAYFRMAGLL